MKKAPWLHNKKHNKKNKLNKKGKNRPMSNPHYQNTPYDLGRSGLDDYHPIHRCPDPDSIANHAIQNVKLPAFYYSETDYNNKHCVHVILSDRAYTSIINDVLQNGKLETGMVLLGNIVGKIWYVTECIPGGPESFNTRNDFVLDLAFVNYLVKKTSSLYRHPVSILGFYHRHPGSMDYFSATDLATIRDNLVSCPNGLLSMLVNVDPDLRMTFYYCRDNRLMRVGYDHGDEYFPKELLEMASPRQLIEHSASPEARHMNVVYNRILSPEKLFELTTAPAVPPAKERAHTEEKEKSTLTYRYEARPVPAAASSPADSAPATACGRKPELPAPPDAPVSPAVSMLDAKPSHACSSAHDNITGAVPPVARFAPRVSSADKPSYAYSSAHDNNLGAARPDIVAASHCSRKHRKAPFCYWIWITKSDIAQPYPTNTLST